MNVAFDRTIVDRHQVSFLAGFDVRELVRDLKVAQYYGYNPENGSFKSVPYGVEFRGLNGKQGVSTIGDNNRIESFNDRFRAYYANASYTFDQKYIWSGSFRKDASNMFGVRANERGQPFWSMGLAWLLSKEGFLADRYFNYLKLRATYGYNGNINSGTSPLPTIYVESQAHYITGQTYGFISKPPNPNLRWERVGNINFGLDFGTSDNRLSGSIEYYQKRPKDLIAAAEVDPTVGFMEQTINVANMLLKGWDISLNARPLRSRNFAWTMNLVFSHNESKVTKAYLKTDLASFNVSKTSVLFKAIEGRDPFSLLTYKFAGLDPLDGSPQFYVNGEVSKDYSAVLNAKTSTLQNHGSQRPVYFGSLRNSLRYKGLELSWNISYQLGHKFLRETFNSDIFFDQGYGHKDYALRWQKPGDEAFTDIPAFVYPVNSLASQAYRGSSALVERADQIKLRDIQASFAMPSLARHGFRNFRIYAYLNNIGTIWQANKKDIDNEYSTWVPDPLSSSLGLNFNF